MTMNKEANTELMDLAIEYIQLLDQQKQMESKQKEMEITIVKKLMETESITEQAKVIAFLGGKMGL